VKVLLDTHAFLWIAIAPERLSTYAADVCASGELIVSVATIWEIAIKSQIGKLVLRMPMKEFLDLHIRNTGLAILPVLYRHAVRVADFPLLHPLIHKDPFDRILAAQSVEEDIPIVTSDPQLKMYGVRTIW
jgi:PIN domain nuclease of toxin-antitoxin system